MCRIALEVVRRGSRLRSLLPSNARGWLSLLEDVMNSPFVVRKQAELASSFLQRREYEHISMDATIRIMREIKGQADYRSPAEVRNSAPIPDKDAKRRLLTVLGRSSVPLAALLVADEGTSSIVDAVSAHWDSDARDQVLTMSSDQPSGALYSGLKTKFRNLKVLALDPVHICMTYEQCHFHKRTDGSRALRVLFGKFSRDSSELDDQAWGPIYTGETHEHKSMALEDKARQQVLLGNMTPAVAQRVLQNVDPDTPWADTLEFVRAMAAFTSIFKGELNRRTHQAGVTLRKLLYNCTCPSRMQWYFNHLRRLHLVEPAARALLASGSP